MRYLVAATLLALAPLAARAHMVYLVPTADGAAAAVVFSDTLAADPKVSVARLHGLKLTARAGAGQESPVELDKADHQLTAAKGIGNAKVVYGSVVYGFASKAETPALLVYHPKYVAPGVTGKEAAVGDKCALEIVPVTVGGKTRFQLLAAGKPVEGGEGSVTRPDGKKEALKTDKDGFTAAFEPTGRYAATLRHTEAKPGEHEGKKYAEVKHFATLVVDVK